MAAAEFRELLDRETVELHLEAESKDEAILRLSRLLLKAGYICDLEGFAEDVYSREREGITGIGKGIAIPHGKSGFVKRAGAAVGRLPRGILWESLDGLPVDMVFLFAVPDDARGAKAHVRHLAGLARALGDRERFSRIKGCEGFEELWEALGDG